MKFRRYGGTPVNDRKRQDLTQMALHGDFAAQNAAQLRTHLNQRFTTFF